MSPGQDPIDALGALVVWCLQVLIGLISVVLVLWMVWES